MDKHGSTRINTDGLHTQVKTERAQKIIQWSKEVNLDCIGDSCTVGSKRWIHEKLKARDGQSTFNPERTHSS